MEVSEESATQSALTDSLDKRIKQIVRLYRDFEEECDPKIDQIDRIHLRKKVEDLEQGRFLLVVTGEVSSGKSTFINALLGEELLPTGVEQTTSAIINLRYGEEKTLCVTFADQKKKCYIASTTEDWESKVSKRLRELGAVPDTFDDVPVTLLQTFRVQHGDNWKAALPQLVREIEPELKHNPRKYDVEKLEKRCLAYLDKHGRLGDIPTSIEITYPFPHASSRLQIVDSPGVHAVGSVENITHEYLNEAHAVLFLRSVSDPAESTSFFKFVDDNVVDRSHEALFLVLTKASKEGRRAIRKKSAQYEDLFAERNIGADHILVVDSLLRLVAGDVSSSANVTELRKDYEKQLDDYDERAEKGDVVAENHAIELGEKLALLERYERGATDSLLLRDELNSDAGFENVEERLARLAERSVDLQAEEILCKLRKGLQNALRALEENIQIDEAALESKEKLETEIGEREGELKKLKAAFSIERENLDKAHTKVSSNKRDAIDEEIKKVEKDLDNASNENALKTECLRISESGKSLTEVWMNELVQSCDRILDDYDDSVGTRTLSIPKVEPDQDLIDDIERKHTSKKRVKEGKTFNKKTRVKKVFDRDGYITTLRKKLQQDVDESGDELWENYKEAAKRVLDDYETKLKDIIDGKEEEYKRRLRENVKLKERQKRLNENRSRLDAVNEICQDATSCLVNIKPNARCLTSS